MSGASQTEIPGKPEVQAPCFSTCSFRLFEEYPLFLFGVRMNYLMGSENLPSECLSEHGGIRILDLFFLISLFVFPGGALREPDLGSVQLKKRQSGLCLHFLLPFPQAT